MFQDIYYKILDSDNLVRNDFHPDKNKVCRFCGESFPKVTFNTRPHMIPELLGRNDFVSDIECDKCNKNFSNFENNHSTFIQPYITFCGLKTKKKIPSFESRKDGLENLTRIKRSEKSVEVDLGTNLDDFNYKEDGESLTITLKKNHIFPI